MTDADTERVWLHCVHCNRTQQQGRRGIALGNYSQFPALSQFSAIFFTIALGLSCLFHL